MHPQYRRSEVVTVVIFRLYSIVMSIFILVTTIGYLKQYANCSGCHTAGMYTNWQANRYMLHLWDDPGIEDDSLLSEKELYLILNGHQLTQLDPSTKKYTIV